jgi:hypothetical protein
MTTNPIFTVSSSDPLPDAGFAIDPKKGVISFFVIGPAPADSGLAFGGNPGAKVSLAPASGDGPLFLDDHNNFDVSASSVLGALGVYYNVPPGEYTLTVDDSTKDCAPISFPFGGWGYPVPPSSIKFPVLAGFTTTQVGVLCTKKVAIAATD